MQDKEINQILGIPITTMQNWKKSGDYKLVLYELLKSMDKEELQRKVEAIKLLKGMN